MPDLFDLTADDLLGTNGTVPEPAPTAVADPFDLTADDLLGEESADTRRQHYRSEIDRLDQTRPTGDGLPGQFARNFTQAATIPADLMSRLTDAVGVTQGNHAEIQAIRSDYQPPAPRNLADRVAAVLGQGAAVIPQAVAAGPLAGFQAAAIPATLSARAVATLSASLGVSEEAAAGMLNAAVINGTLESPAQLSQALAEIDNGTGASNALVRALARTAGNTAIGGAMGATGLEAIPKMMREGVAPAEASRLLPEALKTYAKEGGEEVFQNANEATVDQTRLDPMDQLATFLGAGAIGAGVEHGPRAIAAGVQQVDPAPNLAQLTSAPQQAPGAAVQDEAAQEEPAQALQPDPMAQQAPAPADDMAAIADEVGMTPDEYARHSASMDDVVAQPEEEPVAIADSPIHGKGVQATADIPAGADVGTASNAETKRTQAGRFVNHSSTPNSSLKLQPDGSMTFVAKKPLKAGEEVTIDYRQQVELLRQRKNQNLESAPTPSPSATAAPALSGQPAVAPSSAQPASTGAPAIPIDDRPTQQRFAAWEMQGSSVPGEPKKIVKSQNPRIPLTTFTSHDEHGKPNGVMKLLDTDDEGKSLMISVRPDSRRQGVATQLFEAAKRAGMDPEEYSAGKGNTLTADGAAFRQSRLAKKAENDHARDPQASAAANLETGDQSRVDAAPGRILDAGAPRAVEGDATGRPEDMPAQPVVAEDRPVEPKAPERVRIGSVDTPAQGALESAKLAVPPAWKRLKALRAKVKAAGPQAGNLRVNLLRAESAHRDALARVKAAKAAIEKRAQSLGQTTVAKADKLAYEPQEGLTATQRAAETRMAGILSDRPKADTAYAALPDTDGGRVLNVDSVRELSPDYREDRPEFSQAVHEPASAYIKDRYKRMLADKSLPGVPVVRILAGGGGSGKSTALAAMSHEEAPQITLDATLARHDSAKGVIDQALAAGKSVSIEYVHRPFPQAVAGVVNRSRPGKDGKPQRTVRLAELTKAHIGAQNTLDRLAQTFAGDPRVSIRVWDNSGERVTPETMSVADVVASRYDQGDGNGNALAGLEQQGREAIQYEHQQKPIPDAILKAVDPSGFASGAYADAVQSGGVRGLEQARGGAVPAGAEQSPGAETPSLKPGQQAAPVRNLADQPVSPKSKRAGRIQPEPIAPTSATAAEPVKRLRSIIRSLREKLTAAGAGDPGLYEGEAPREVGGIFDESTGMAALSRHGDLDAAAHEVGHRIAWRFNLDSASEQGLALEIADLARHGSEPPADLPGGKDARDAYRRKEGWAEFIRALIVNPGETAERYPAMLKVFEQEVPAGVRSALADYGKAARSFLGLAPEARTEANIQSIRDLIAENKFHVAVANWFNLPDALAAARSQPKAYAKLTAFMREVWNGMGTGAQDTRAASGSQATPERIAELRRTMTPWIKFRFLWQNVWAPAYNRFAEGYGRRGIDSEKLPPESNWRVLNRLMAGTDGRALEQVFGTGLVDGRNRPVVDGETGGQRMNWAWLLEPVSRKHAPEKTVRLIDKALAMGVEQRTAAEGDKRRAQADKDIAQFVEGLEEYAAGHGDVNDLNALISTYQELTNDPAQAAALRVEAMSLSKSKRKPDLRRLTRWTEKFSRLRRQQAAEAAARITGIGGGLVSDELQAKAALGNRDRQEDPDRADMDEFLRRYRRWAGHLVHLMTEKGVYTAEAAQAMLESGTWTNPDTGEILDTYIDLHRIFEGEDTSARIGGRFKGSTRMVANPLRNLIEATLNAIERGERNQAMNALTDAFRGDTEARVDLHDLGRQVPQEAVEAARKDGGSGLVNGRKPYRVMRNGVAEYWTFDPWIEASMEAARIHGDGNLLVRLWGQLTRMMRAGITTAPSFLVRNVLRDIQGRVIASESAKGAGLKAIFDGFGKLNTKEGARTVDELHKLAGGSYAGYVDGKSALGSELARHLDQLVQRGAAGKAVRVMSPRNLLHLSERVGELSEGVNRKAEFVTAFREAKARGLDDYNASLAAADKSRGLIDFAEAGQWGRQLTRAVLFLNPAIQGLSRFTRTWKLVADQVAAGKTPTEKLRNLVTSRAVVAMGAMTAASVGLRMLVKAAFGDDEEEKWRQQPASIRDFHWIVPMPTGVPDLAIPKEYAWGFMMSGAERLADAVMAKAEGREQDAKHAMDGYAKSAAGALLPINDVSSLMGGFGPLIETVSNYDSFRQRNIIPPWERSLNVELRDTSRASALGKTFQDLMGVDARLFDHVVEGYTGNWGRMATSSGRPAEWWAGTVSGLGKSDPASSARDVEWVQDYTDGQGLQQRPAVKMLRKKLKAVYEATDADGREKAATEARKYATMLRASIEKNPGAWKGKEKN